MFDLTGKTALVTGATGGIGGAIARALHAQGAHGRAVRHAREALEALAGELGERAHVLPCDLVRTRRRSRRWSRRAEAGAGPARHPGQQCRHHPRQPVHAHEGRGLGRGDRRQPDRRPSACRARRCAA